MNDELSTLLAALPEPEAPSSMTATVMARLAREEDARQTLAVAVPARREWPAWALAVAGASSVAGVFLGAWWVSGQVPTLWSPHFSGPRPEAVPLAGSLYLYMAIALAVYFAGLFAPVRFRRATRPPAD